MLRNELGSVVLSLRYGSVKITVTSRDGSVKSIVMSSVTSLVTSRDASVKSMVRVMFRLR